MIKNYALLALFINSSVVFSADICPYFLRINEANSTSEVAFRSFLSKDGKTTVQLIGMVHQALPSFYENVSDMISGKVVLYELADSDLAGYRKLEERIADLGKRYERIFEAMQKSRPDSLGRIAQDLNNPSYAKAKELIRADREVKFEQILGQHKNPHEMNDTELKEHLDTVVSNTFRRCDIQIEEGEDVVEQFDVCLNKMCARHDATRLSRFEVEDIKQDLSNIDLLRKGQCPQNLKIRFGNEWREICLGRNQYIFSVLEDLCLRDQAIEQIAIVWGASHMGFVQDYLLENGYQHLCGLDGWLVTAKIGT